jgi:hypothetical protein
MTSEDFSLLKSSRANFSKLNQTFAPILKTYQSTTYRGSFFSKRDFENTINTLSNDNEKFQTNTSAATSYSTDNNITRVNMTSQKLPIFYKGLPHGFVEKVEIATRDLIGYTCFKNGKEVNRLSGALPPDELEEFLKQLLN